MKFQESRGGALWVVSGLGQEAIERQDFQNYLFLDNENTLEFFNLDNNNYNFCLQCILYKY